MPSRLRSDLDCTPESTSTFNAAVTVAGSTIPAMRPF
jgi:hypothetical protein